MLQESYCKVLCQVHLGNDDASKFKKAIRREYHNNWIVDNLPAASITDSDLFITTQYVGFPVGYRTETPDNKGDYIFNHVNIILEYKTVSEDIYRIVGFYVEPLSIKHEFTGGRSWDGKNDAPPLLTCSSTEHTEYDSARPAQRIEPDTTMLFTYDVMWRESNIMWASRWDVYLSNNNAASNRVHWFSIINSILIVLFLAFMIAMILVRTLNRDIAKYNRIPTDEEKAEEREESGWKLVHADVFRPPAQYPMMFCVLVGSGVQIALAALFFIFFAALGFLSPANRGSIMIGMLLIFVLLGSVAGFTSARLYKTFKGKLWQRCTVLTATLFPGFCFALFFLLDVMVWSYGSTGAIPILSMLALLTLWFGISVPLVFLGAYFGYRKEPLTFPVVTSNIPRQIPTQPWFLSITSCALLGGILPFGACFIEMFFIMSSIWMDQYYYVFGFLLLSFIILAITAAEITIVACYFQLCSEDYHWWWRSFVTAGSTGLYVFLYACIYFTRLQSNMFVTYCLYFGYMFMISSAVAIMAGSIGFFACLYFTHTIYSSIKVD